MGIDEVRSSGEIQDSHTTQIAEVVTDVVGKVES